MIAIVVEPSEIVGGSSRKLYANIAWTLTSGRTTGSWCEMRLVCLASELAALFVFLYWSAILYRVSASTPVASFAGFIRRFIFFRFSGGL
jgi:hypothetical protein